MPAFQLNSKTVIEAGQVIDTAALDGVGYFVAQGAVSADLTNRGSIAFGLAAGQAQAVAVQTAPGGPAIGWVPLAIDNEGAFSVVSSGKAAFVAGDSSVTLTNSGLITITGALGAQGLDISEIAPIFSPDTATTVTNSGRILVSGGGVVNGFFLGDGSIVTNTGLISAVGTTPDAVVHGIVSRFVLLVENHGEIIATDANPEVDSIAIQFGGGPNSVVTNTGTITGDIAIEDVNTTNGDSQYAGISNSGVINGRIIMGIGLALPPNNTRSISNAGTINGAVDMGPGDDSFFGQSGVQNGLVSGGLGADRLYGGSLTDSLQGNQGNDTLYGGAGDDIVVGGKDDDQQYGEAGNDIVWGNLGADTLSGGDGADQVRGGQGNDSVSGGAGDDFVSGDRGDDTVAGGAGADLFHGSQDAGLDRVIDFNVAEGDRVFLDPGTTYTVSQTGADTVIDMGGGNRMVLVGVPITSLPSGWIFGA